MHDLTREKLEAERYEPPTPPEPRTWRVTCELTAPTRKDAWRLLQAAVDVLGNVETLGAVADCLDCAQIGKEAGTPQERRT